MPQKIDLTGNDSALIGTPDPLLHGIAATMRDSGANVSLYTLNEFEALDHAHTRFDAAIFSPGVLTVAPFLETTPADWEHAIHENIERILWASQATARAMIARNAPGRLIFLTSVAANMPFVESSIIGTTLATLTGIARMAAVTLAPHRITVNTIACGWVGAGWQESVLEGQQAHIVEGIPGREVGTPADVGQACCFLASPMSSYITGTTLTVDGGYTLTRASGRSPYQL